MADFKKHYKLIKERCNIPQREVDALHELQHAKHIVIKPADKGSVVVILSRDQYGLEVERQLNDARYYKKLDEPIYMHTIPMVVSIVDSLKKKKFITAKQRQYLIASTQPRERRFYILPKIHESHINGQSRSKFCQEGQSFRIAGVTHIRRLNFKINI